MKKNVDTLTKNKWTDYFDNEQELITYMLKTRTEQDIYYTWALVKGYVYLDSFKKYYYKNGKLTDKQMTQLKRLAKEIWKQFNWDNQMTKQNMFK